ncbi:MAG: hypothetical protein DRJ45_00735 [Thermoprotei archaeon]|nr:MAG: hypothetical protein DRJ45_00735 [Thermoprotei archaeon]
MKIIIHMVMKYISENHRDAKNFVSENFRMKSYSENASCIIYRFENTGWILSITFYKYNYSFIVVADYSTGRIPGYIGIMHRIIWEGIFTNSGEMIEKKYVHAV